MDVGEFLLLLRELNLLKNNSKHEIGDKSHKGKKARKLYRGQTNINFLSVRKARLIFAQSMQFSYGLRQKDEELYYRQTQMTYIEYLEALARVALEAFGTDVSGVHGMDLPKALEKLATCHIRQLVIQHSLNAKRSECSKRKER